MAKLLTRSQGYSSWGWTYDGHGNRTPLVDYDKKEQQSDFKLRMVRKKSINEYPLENNRVCPKCHYKLPLSGKCDCED